MNLTKLNKKILGLALSMCLAVPAFASISISPTRLEVNANKIKNNYYSTAIDIKGDSSQPMRFKVYPKFFTINEKNEMILQEKSTDPHDLSKKIRFVPSEFTVAQGKSQKVRINIPALNTLPDGENRVVLFVEDVNPKEMNIPTGVSGIGAQLIIKTRIGVPVYVDKGKFNKVAEIEYLNVERAKDGLYTNMKLVSSGNSKVRYSTNAQIIQGKKLIDEFSMPGGVVGHNNYFIYKRKIDTSNIKAPGEYTLRIIISYFDENGKRKNIKKETTITIDKV